MSQINFDASQVAPQAVMEAIPAGWYNVMATESELKPTKGGNGHYLEMTFQILDGQFAQRKLFDRFNIDNQNPIAVEIARKQLSALCHAAGVMQVADSSQLHNIPVKVRVKVRKATDDYDESNEINAYDNVNRVVKAPTSAAAALPATMPAPTWTPPQGTQPWAGAPAQPPAPNTAPAQGWAGPQVTQAPPAQYAPPAQQQAPAMQADNTLPAWANQAPQQGAPAPQQSAPPQLPAQQEPATGVVPPWLQQPAQ